jgi:hypothetical protein
MGFQLLIAEALLGLAEVAVLQEDFTQALQFAVVASRALTTENQQPASFHQAAITRIERQLEQALDQPARQAIRTAAETATLGHVLARMATDTRD